ncbi:MAG: hypothetical protein CMJ89_11555, partial [Planctomycetes bacterium]|nr:hypothetical protein [Planctomycetota bacterium]
MSEMEWPEEAPPKKGGIPNWVWIGCGGGCLVTLILVAAGSFWVMGAFKQAKDPEMVWPIVEKALPFDERPEGWEVSGLGILGTNQVMMDPPNESAVIMLQYFDERAGVEELFDPDSTANNIVFVGIEDAELGEIEIQERSTRCLRFISPTPGSDVQAPSIRVDLSGEGALYVCFQVIL